MSKQFDETEEKILSQRAIGIGLAIALAVVVVVVKILLG